MLASDTLGVSWTALSAFTNVPARDTRKLCSQPTSVRGLVAVGLKSLQPPVQKHSFSFFLQSRACKQSECARATTNANTCLSVKAPRSSQPSKGLGVRERD